MKFFLNKKILFTAMSLLSVLCGTAAVLAEKAPVKVACIGNSITYGLTIPDREVNAYPFQLQRMLGEGYAVGNFGKSGATLLHHGHRPYVCEPEYAAALEFKPDIAVIHLGVNDTDPRNWPDFNDEFVGDYMALIDTLRQVNPDVRIIIARLSPLRATHYRFKSGTRDWRLQIQSQIDGIARAAGVELIDFDIPLRDRQDLLPDGIHPNAVGAGLLARTVFGAITGNYGGLQMPQVYASGMVLQRDRYLKIRGRGNAGSEIAVSIAGRTVRTRTDNRGDWCVTVPPLNAGTGYTLTVTDGRDTLRFDDVAAGEVWLASGQSNMEFLLNAAVGGKDAVAASADPDLRFFDLKPIALTNDKEWPDSILAAVDTLGYFREARWAAASPSVCGNWSAVAYWFARELRDSLNVPVGVISTAVGGSPIESWVDINMLEMYLPEILNNWRNSDFVQPWVRQRADRNTSVRNHEARHPYNPSYLFSAAIRPLGQYPVAGVIWYQGESNANNIEVHETLFPLLAKSWRNYFADSSMPVIYAQLSSLSRRSWPQFRDSQRRLMELVPESYMVVTSDAGDSLDVHPRNKMPVGHRMAVSALHHVYGYDDVVPSGPLPVSAEAHDGAIWITMDFADGMHASGGGELLTFEVAETDGLFYQAKAEIIDNKIKVYNMDIQQPRYVRYGWQPFTRANLVNGAGLPASTFKMEAAGADLTQPESGMEVGVSACFAGSVGDMLIMAGGCNFPERPLASDSRKKFYKGIYMAYNADMQWCKIGELPESAAYGASVTLSGGILMIGGTTADRALDSVWSLQLSADGVPVVTTLPSLPCTLDNMAACAIGNKVYVAGGNRDGKPSRGLLMLDLDDLSKGWRELRDMPGNPRVQPVMVAARDAAGDMKLYLWGGFAGKYDGRDASLETGGLLYDPVKNKWSSLPAPVGEDGQEISLGGGSACVISDGRILAVGGVNKDVFLAALRNQPVDYLSHPIEWYRFNDHEMVFDPVIGRWAVAGRDAGAARAGAAIVSGNACDYYLIGGELKPRIRTAEILHSSLPCR